MDEGGEVGDNYMVLFEVYCYDFKLLLMNIQFFMGYLMNFQFLYLCIMEIFY